MKNLNKIIENKFSELLETFFTSIQRIGVADDFSQQALKEFVE